MRYLIAPDSFKGSLTASAAADAMAAGVRRAAPDAAIDILPLGDGGEGTLNAVVSATAGRLISMTVTGPLGGPVSADYGLLGPEGSTAVVEMAQAAGLNLVSEEQRNPLRTSTYGVGQLIKAAIESGAEKIVICIGGSATNDGGAGMAQALGARFYDSAGKELAPGIAGGDLTGIARIELGAFLSANGLPDVVVASDVTNPLVGPAGAAAVYGPQKGATPEMVRILDKGLVHYAVVIARDIGVDIRTVPGAGAAGGLGGGLLAFLAARMTSGIDLVLDTVGFDSRAHVADWIFTGEGAIDRQTLQGKVVAGVLARSRKVGNGKVVAFAGSVDPDAAQALTAGGLRVAIPITRDGIAIEIAMRDAGLLLEEAVARFAHSIG